MKKCYKIIVIISIFLLSGCGNHTTLNISTNSITNIIYDGINISNNDFEDILNKINNNIFDDLYNIKANGKDLTITTKEYTYNFKILDNYIIYNKDDKNYYARINDFTKFIKNIVEKYKKDDFFNITVEKNYDTNNSDFLIKLDDSNNYVIINTYLNIYDFEVINNNYVSNTQNKITKIDNNKIICIETSNLNDLFIKFKNPYNYEVTLSYNNGFITKMNKIGE